MNIILDITGCRFPFVDNQNQTHNTCITTSDVFSGTVPWCRDALGRPISCAGMNKEKHKSIILFTNK